MPEVVKKDFATDIPTQLRELAKEIEEGRHPTCRAVVAIMVREGPETPVVVWGWGRLSVLETIGACTKAASRLSFNDMEDDDAQGNEGS